MNEQELSWQRLSDILNGLGGEPSYLSILVNYEVAIANAIRSGTVPVRGHPYGGPFAFDRIEERINANASISILTNTVYLCVGDIRVQFIDVEADFVAVQSWIHENAMPRIVEGREELSGDERHCRDWLRALPERPRLAKAEAFKKYKASTQTSNLRPIAQRSFNRAWEAGAHSAWRKSGRPKGK